MNTSRNDENLTGTSTTIENTKEEASKTEIEQGTNAIERNTASALLQSRNTKLELYIKENLPFIMKSGIRELDRLTGGFWGPNLYLIAGIPGSGRTGLISTLIQYMHEKYKATMTCFSLEQDINDFLDKLISNTLRAPINEVNFSRTIDQKNFNEHMHIASEFDSMNLYIYGHEKSTLSSIYNTLKSQCKKPDIVFIDSFNFMKSSEQPFSYDLKEYNEIVSGLKSMCYEFQIPIVVTCSAEATPYLKRGDPDLSDLRQYGDLSHIADQVIFLNCRKHRKQTRNRQVDCCVIKNRLGDEGKVPISFNADYYRFENEDNESE